MVSRVVVWRQWANRHDAGGLMPQFKWLKLSFSYSLGGWILSGEGCPQICAAHMPSGVSDPADSQCRKSRQNLPQNLRHEFPHGLIWESPMRNPPILWLDSRVNPVNPMGLFDKVSPKHVLPNCWCCGASQPTPRRGPWVSTPPNRPQDFHQHLGVSFYLFYFFGGELRLCHNHLKQP